MLKLLLQLKAVSQMDIVIAPSYENGEEGIGTATGQSWPLNRVSHIQYARLVTSVEGPFSFLY